MSRAGEEGRSVDQLVAADLKDCAIPVAACDDAVFIRRVYLDMTGTLPRAGGEGLPWKTGGRTSGLPSSTACSTTTPGRTTRPCTGATGCG
ncbi:MAG: hypothetical protein U1F77_03725 [Kiritimatiellia bacterium]